MKPVTIKGKTVKVNFWDLSGQPEFFEIRNEFYKSTQGVRLCCTLHIVQQSCLSLAVPFAPGSHGIRCHIPCLI